MTAEKKPKYIRGGPPRVFRSVLTGVWYVVTAYHDLGDGRFIAAKKRQIHDDDARLLELNWNLAQSLSAAMVTNVGPDQQQEAKDLAWEHARKVAGLGPLPGGRVEVTLNERGALGHHGSDDYTTCTEPMHWDKVPSDA